MISKKLILFITLVFACVFNVNAQFHTIEIEVDSSKKKQDYTNENPRGINVNTLDSNARVSGNYPRGFFPNQKIVASKSSKKDSLVNKPENVFIKKEDYDE